MSIAWTPRGVAAATVMSNHINAANMVRRHARGVVGSRCISNRAAWAISSANTPNATNANSTSGWRTVRTVAAR